MGGPYCKLWPLCDSPMIRKYVDGLTYSMNYSLYPYGAFRIVKRFQLDLDARNRNCYFLIKHTEQGDILRALKVLIKEVKYPKDHARSQALIDLIEKQPSWKSGPLRGQRRNLILHEHGCRELVWVLGALINSAVTKK